MKTKKGTTALTHKDTKSKPFAEFNISENILIPALALFIGVSIGLFSCWLLMRKRITASGYVQLRSISGRRKFEHRKIAERILRRTLERDEVVHHINGRRSDNRPENLCVMNCNDHDEYHAWYKRVFESCGRYARRETQLRKLREDFGGILLADVLIRRSRTD